ncbi:MAG: flagellar motor switch protein FliG, partial [Rhodobacteraceae bacterium]|nr:flagellar motor switch protein FliG [Paracoccaceae bacterium]
MSAVAQTFSHPAPSDISGSGVFLSAHSLTGPQKAAIIVRLLLAQGSDFPLASLPDHLQAALTEQIGTMRTIDRDTL